MIKKKINIRGVKMKRILNEENKNIYMYTNVHIHSLICIYTMEKYS